MATTNGAAAETNGANGATDTNAGHVRAADITQEMQTAYLDYAMSVIVARALPDVRDGLKPVHRRILYAMWHDLSLTHDKPHKKSARIVGEVLGKYHPHGDTAVYDAMVRMAQPFSLRYPLIDGQGNFGSIDGDNAAAMRYTEARLARLADLMLEDLEKETVEWHDNFDNTLREPDILPAALPNLLINGSSGIAVGMATNIPPHNLGEVVDGLVFMIDRFDKVDDITGEELMHFIKGPDFPTGGILYRYREEGKGEDDADAIAQGYSMGKSRLIIQAKAHFEEISRGRTRIVITELPYQTNKTALIERIADLVRDGKIEGISDLRDESDRTGMRIVIELTRTVEPKDVLANLFKYTPLQQTFGMQMLALVDGHPRLLSLKRMLQLFIHHRQEIIRRRSEYELKKARERAHIVEGLLRALDILDEVIQTIRRSQTRRHGAQEPDGELQVQRVAGAGDPRHAVAPAGRARTQKAARGVQRPQKAHRLSRRPAGEPAQGARRDQGRAAGDQGGVWRRPPHADRRPHQRHAHDDRPAARPTGVGQPEQERRSAPPGRQQARPRHDEADRQGQPGGAAYRQHARPPLRLQQGRALQPLRHPRNPRGGRQEGLRTDRLFGARCHHRGRDAAARTQWRRRRLPLPGDGSGHGEARRHGRCPGQHGQRVHGDECRGEGAAAVGAAHARRQEVILVSAQGQSIRFGEEEVRSMGLAAGGVGGMKLKKKDRIVYAGVVDPEGELLTMTAAGFGKRSPLSEYSVQGRNGGGIVTHKITDKTGEVVAALVLPPKSENAWLVFVTGRGVAKAALTVEVPAMGRSVLGKVVIEASPQDGLATIWRPDAGAHSAEEPPVDPAPPGDRLLPKSAPPAAPKKPVTAPLPLKTVTPCEPR
jgi:DNA gyrase subunit A